MCFKYIPAHTVLDLSDKFKPISLNNAILNEDATKCCELKAAPLFDLVAAVLSQVRVNILYRGSTYKEIC